VILDAFLLEAFLPFAGCFVTDCLLPAESLLFADDVDFLGEAYVTIGGLISLTSNERGSCSEPDEIANLDVALFIRLTCSDFVGGTSCDSFRTEDFSRDLFDLVSLTDGFSTDASWGCGFLTFRGISTLICK